ncbi:hypothetical protein OIU79_026134 [Salix purpurea]|uniref:Uncharacterized protein n=1 Tax=Salix purpurea TaxID=77065 RepID=A0A9Q0VRX6_SALPP|nr:hypothetical protein OIU79_026134 [Salix purpurea]
MDEGPLSNEDTVALEEDPLPNEDNVAGVATPVNLPKENNGLAKEDEGALVVVDDDQGNSAQESKKHEQTDNMKQFRRWPRSNRQQLFCSFING